MDSLRKEMEAMAATKRAQDQTIEDLQGRSFSFLPEVVPIFMFFCTPDSAEVHTLNRRLNERGVDVTTERKLQQVCRLVMPHGCDLVIGV